MTRTDIARSPVWHRISCLVALICTVGLAACAPIANTSRGGGQTVADRGIGGTGLSGDDSGIGGTGIIGTITGFGSIIVNGLEVEFDDATPLFNDATPGTTAGLSVGQVVAIEAETVSGQLVAQSIIVQSAVSGPISSLSPNESSFTVLGQRIALGPNALIDGNPIRIQDLTVGQWLTIGGLRRPDGRIVASYIERRPAGRTASIRGTVAARTSTGFTIGGLAIVVADGLSVPEPGGSVFTSGRLVQSGLLAARIDVSPRLPFDGRMTRLSLEGFVDTSRQQLVGNGFAIALDAALPLTTGSRVAIDAHFGVDGGLEVEEIFRIDPAATDVDNNAPSSVPGELREREPSLMRRWIQPCCPIALCAA